MDNPTISNNPSKPKYGLMDSFYRYLWVIVSDEQNAHYIKKTFWAKTQMAVFDLTQFTNYSTENISNFNSFNYSLDYTSYESALIYPTTTNKAFDITHNTYSSNNLIVQFTSKSPMPDDIRNDLKNQMIFYLECIERIQSKCGRFSENLNKDFDDFFNDFTKIFQVELTLADIQEQVYQFAISNLRTNFFPPFVLLNVLKRQYE